MTRTIVLGLVLAQACSSAPDAFSDAHVAAVRDSVQAALSQFQGYSAQAQWDSLSGLYSSSESFRFLENGAVRYDSRAAIRNALDGLPAGSRITTTYRDLEIDPIAPGVAMVTGLFDTRIADSTGQGFSFSGGLSLLWMHEADGWKIRSGHSSSPVPRGA